MAKRKIKKKLISFNTLADAEASDLRYYKNLTPQQRLDQALEIMEPFYEAYPRFERIYRTSELG